MSGLWVNWTRFSDPLFPRGKSLICITPKFSSSCKFFKSVKGHTYICLPEMNQLVLFVIEWKSLLGLEITAQWLRRHTAFAKDLSFVHCIHTGRVTATVTLALKDLLYSLSWACCRQLQWCSNPHNSFLLKVFLLHNSSFEVLFLKFFFCSYQIYFKQEDRFLSIELLFSWKHSFMVLLKISCDLTT